eukprot:TRINITY_DN2176_c0_g1_i1.p1 TRINITY_DN2176_c0_g1~~TRINITY_DN2176_c0_g1_i1.p1  ORF type:complete len:487 (-),score=137.39 TRINITY_DN2176_c0_g1_i1:44-1303(-)
MVLVSKQWRAASEDHRLWRHICLAELTPELREEEICVEHRDYKQFFKTKWLIRKWKQSHRRRVRQIGQSSTDADKLEYEEYKELNFLFEEKLLDLQEMVSYKMVFLLRLFNSPLVDYAGIVLWMLTGVFVVLKLDAFITWNWGLVLIPCWLLSVMVLWSSATWWYFFVRGFMDKDFMSRCLFGWINLLCSCFSDDTVECTLWFVGIITIGTFPPAVSLFRECKPLWNATGPWPIFVPLLCANALVTAIFVRDIFVKASENKQLKGALCLVTLLTLTFLVFGLLNAQGVVQWSPWFTFMPMWFVHMLALTSAFTMCDLRFYRRVAWLPTGLLVAGVVFVALAPLLATEVLLCCKLVGTPVTLFIEVFAPLGVVLLSFFVMLLVGDLHLWSRLKHFWVLKRSFKFSLREHWRTRDSIVVLD